MNIEAARANRAALILVEYIEFWKVFACIRQLRCKFTKGIIWSSMYSNEWQLACRRIGQASEKILDCLGTALLTQGRIDYRLAMPSCDQRSCRWGADIRFALLAGFFLRQIALQCCRTLLPGEPVAGNSRQASVAPRILLRIVLSGVSTSLFMTIEMTIEITIAAQRMP